MFASPSTVLLGFFSTVVLASALSNRQISSGCTPSFQGIPVNIMVGDGGNGLAPSNDSTGSYILNDGCIHSNPLFLLENTGHSPSSFIIKDQNNHDLVVYAASGTSPAIQLNAIDNSGQDERQDWIINCSTCAEASNPVPTVGGTFGQWCQIANSLTGLCVQPEGSAGTFPVLTACDVTNSNQKFDFVRGLN
ncbi:hypothetical protein FB45DRAFT_1035794 [Roridomyces roridus]|uniref:Ricin B lectin domain-containing protein n=1 Tax=Roridomyces roridus TaxID=1738132 RepID=A0AAD7BAF1_9AGAR|nr:hypothetical protein FB45DRAFT_1035794 [Roridomyces roridus]